MTASGLVSAATGDPEWGRMELQVTTKTDVIACSSVNACSRKPELASAYSKQLSGYSDKHDPMQCVVLSNGDKQGYIVVKQQVF